MKEKRKNTGYFLNQEWELGRNGMNAITMHVPRPGESEYPTAIHQTVDSPHEGLIEMNRNRYSFYFNNRTRLVTGSTFIAKRCHGSFY